MINKTKESGYDWLGKIPSNWITKKGYVIYDINTGSLDANAEEPDGKYPFFTCSDEKKTINTYSFDCEALLVAGNGHVGFTQYYNGKFDAYQRTYVLSNFKMVKPAFLKYYFPILFPMSLESQSFGSVIEFIKKRNLKNFIIPIPSENEQNNIIKFLDAKCFQIDELISKHNLIIEKLDDYRKSIISKAVTNGIDKDVSTKKSKIDYIERVPKHWEMKRLKFVATYIGKGAGITKDDIRENGDTNCVRYGEIYSKYNNTFENCYSKTNIDLVPSPQCFEYGDILFAGTGELIEEIGKNIAYLGKDKCLAGGDIIVLKHNQEPRYLNYLLNSIPIQNQKSCGKAKLKVVHISGSEIGNIKIYLPDITEQKQIADYLDKKYTVIDELIIKQKEAIYKLEEYKKTLIYNAVTGKMNIDGGGH